MGYVGYWKNSERIGELGFPQGVKQVSLSDRISMYVRNMQKKCSAEFDGCVPYAMSALGKFAMLTTYHNRALSDRSVPFSTS